MITRRLRKYLASFLLSFLFLFTVSILICAQEEKMSREEIEEKIQAIENEDITLPDGEKVKYKEVKEIADDPAMQTKFLKRRIDALEDELRELRREFDILKTHYMEHERHPPK
ncbi:MAG: hypothetical protein C4541_07020 [Candidatus Auribacter fodinae]|jgi:hypothetical protein|uniref:Uncharacterized protein n=1 Tax=Candidatus Auribacter fodinae TaxID=2093366 RepID=A0A3A4R881_9BACT|nr:MAG: hypothetical protein C4541_07020 [Candidatus Auribacter fodinae]